MIQIFRPLPVEKLKLLVFDLDGTMVDSAQDLANAVNAALLHVDLPALDNATISGFVGNGVPLLVRRSLGHLLGQAPETVDTALFQRTERFFLDYYREHKLDCTHLYDGVRESLEALARTHTLAVLTNKPVRPAVGISEGLGVAPLFLHIYGGDSFATKKPDPEGLHSLMREVGATPEESVMVGDSKVDVTVARNAGTWSLLCNFGFGQPCPPEFVPDVAVDSAHHWLEVLQQA